MSAMARFFAFFMLFHLSLTIFRPEVPFKSRGSRDEPKNDDGIRYFVKMTNVTSGKKVVVCPKSPIL